MVGARSLAAALSVAVLVAACTQSPQATPNPSPSPTSGWQPQTGWERALEAIDDDGHFSLDAALALFATVFGPIPGTAAQQDLTGVSDLTIAIDAVEAHHAELTPEQRAAIEGLIKAPDGAVTIRIGPSAARAAAGPALARADSPNPALGAQLAGVTDARKAELTAAGNALRSTLAQGLDFDIPDFDIVYAPRPGWIQPSLGLFPLGMSSSEYDSGGTFTGCTITIFNEATGEIDLVLKSLLAHEIFHCFQGQGYGTASARLAAPGWIIEGQASWVGQAVGGVSGKYDRFWDEYLLLPTKSLTTRTYDAIGFYGHLERQFVEGGLSGSAAIDAMWPVLKAMWAEGGDSAGAFQAAGADDNPFADSWASSVTRQAERGNAWNTSGPGITASAYAGLEVGITDGAMINVGQAAFTNDVSTFELDVDLVHFAIDGPARLHDGSRETASLDDVWYCVVGHDCEPDPECPTAAPPPVTAGTIGASVLLATSGGFAGSVGTVQGKDLPDTCESLPPPSLGPAPTGFMTATAHFAFGVPSLEGGWCKIGVDDTGINYFQLWFVSPRPSRDFFDISVASGGPITAGAYTKESHDIISTIRQGSFYYNLSLQVVSVSGTGEAGAFKPTSGSFSGTYWDFDVGPKPISGRFDCRGAIGEFDYAIGTLNFSEVINKETRTIALSVSANSEPDGSSPSGYVQLTRLAEPLYPHVWAFVECLNVSGSAAGIVARTTSDLAPLEAELMPPEADVPAGSLIYIGGRQDDAVERDPTAFRVVNSTATCAPNAFPLDHAESAFQTHDAP